MISERSEPLIVVVEDDAHIRRVLRERLEHQGYCVMCAGDGREAKSVIRQNLPDLLILDVNIPYKDGLSIAQWADDELDYSIPKLVITASREAGLRAQAVALGAEFIEKPFTSPYLLMKVEAALQQGKCRVA